RKHRQLWALFLLACPASPRRVWYERRKENSTIFVNIKKWGRVRGKLDFIGGGRSMVISHWETRQRRRRQQRSCQPSPMPNAQ
ncbi:MAG: hypothetical protein ACYT04_43570, partial [Nostoc sp.]